MPNEETVNRSLKRPGGLSYLEISADDVDASARFYQAVLGWRIDRSDPAALKFIDLGGLLLGRWIPGKPAQPFPGLLPYFYVEDIVQAVDRTVQFGGSVVSPIRDEGSLAVATVRDPGGNLLGIWQDRA